MLQHTANSTNKWVRMLLIVCLYFRIKSNIIYPLAVSVCLKLCNWDLLLLCWDKQVKLLLLWHVLALHGVCFHEHSVHYTLWSPLPRKTARMELIDSRTEMCPFPLSSTGLHKKLAGKPADTWGVIKQQLSASLLDSNKKIKVRKEEQVDRGAKINRAQ